MNLVEKNRQISPISLWQRVLWGFLFSGNDVSKPEVLQTKELPDLSIPEIAWRCGFPSSGSLRSALFHLKNEGALRPMNSLQGLRYRITPEAKDRIFEDFPFARSLVRKWDKTWRIVLFKEEAGRPLADRSARYKQLRRMLKADGFGSLGKGLFLSAAPVSSGLMNQLKTPMFSQIASLFETKGPLIGDAENWLFQAYDLDILDKQYAKLGSKAVHLLNTYSAKKTLTMQEKRSIAGIFDEYLSMIEKTPFIPDEYQSRWPNVSKLHQFVLQLFQRARLRERNSSQVR